MKTGWQTRPVGELLQQTETTNPSQSPEVEFDYVDVSSVSNTTFRIDRTQRLKGKDAPSRARRLVKTNDVLFATVRPTLRRIAMVPEHLDGQVCSTGYIVLRPKAGLDPRFVFYWLFTEDFMAQMESLQKGASYPAVTDGEVRAQAIPVPPVPDQERIVAILDEAFAAIAAARANAEQNLRNARELFEGYLQSVFLQTRDGWNEIQMEALATFRNGINYTKGSRGERVKVVGVGEFQNHFWVPLDNLPVVTLDGKLSPSDALRQGDILVVRSNGNPELVGRSVLVGEIGDKITHSGFTIRIRLSGQDLLPKYLCHFLKSGASRKKLSAAGTGINIKSVNQATLSALTVPVPSVSEQAAIVGGLESLDAEIERLVTTYQRKLDALDALKQSLLHQAFTGAL